MKKYRNYLVWVLALCLSLIAAGCGPSTPANSTESPAPNGTGSQTQEPTDEPEPTEVISKWESPLLPQIELENKHLVMFSGIGFGRDAIKSQTEFPGALEFYEDLYEGTIEFIHADPNEFNEKLGALFMSDSMPDLIYPNQQSFPNDIINNFIQPVDDYIDLSSSLWDDTRDYIEMMSWRGKHYHPILSLGPTNLLFFNPKIFEAQGVDSPLYYYERDEWDWDKLLELAIELTQDTDGDGQMDLWGFAMGYDGRSMFSDFTGVPLVEIDGEEVNINLRDPKIAYAANYLYDLGPGRYDILPPMNHWEIQPDFVQEKIAMISDRIWQVQNNHYTAMSTEGRLDFVPFPKFPDSDTYLVNGYPWFQVIGNKAKNPEAAALFLVLQKYTGSEDYIEKYYGEDKYLPYLYYQSIGFTVEQIDRMEEMRTLPTNLNMFVAWFGTDWNMGFDTMFWENKPWSQVVEEFYPVVQNNVNDLIDRLNELD